MKKVWAIAGVFVLVGLLVGYGAGTWQMQDANEAAYDEGVAYQQSITPQTTVTTTVDEAELEFEWGGDGDFAVPASEAETITITNDDDDETAEDLYLMLYDPTDDTEGLDNDLEEKELTISVTIGGKTVNLFYDEEYRDGYLIGDLGPGESFEFDAFTVELEADHDIDADTYDCELYLYQPDANHVDEFDFTVTI